MAVAANGKYFVSAENDEKIIFWNLKSRVVLYKDSQINVAQLMIIDEFDPNIILAVSKGKNYIQYKFALCSRNFQNMRLSLDFIEV